MERHRRLMVLLLAVAVAVPLFFRSRPSAEDTAPAASPVPAPRQVMVQVGGDVRHPGIYTPDANKMTADVILLAVPLRPVSAFVPPAAGTLPLRSGESLHLAVNRDGSAVVTRGVIPAAQRLVLGLPLDINTVSESDLDLVPGIGPGLARRIVLYRQNNGGKMAVRELQQVEGVGEKKYAALQGYFQQSDFKQLLK
jgi:competence protein ComEA